VRRPPSHVLLALVATVVSVPWLVGVPFGLVALVAAVRVLRGHDDPELADERSERARRWGWGAVLATLLVMLVGLVTGSSWTVFGGG
jgi:hypothetical protein